MNFRVLRIVVVVGLLVMSVIGLVVIAIAVPEVDAKLYKDETGIYIDEELYEDRVLTCYMIQQKTQEGAETKKIWIFKLS